MSIFSFGRRNMNIKRVIFFLFFLVLVVHFVSAAEVFKEFNENLYVTRDYISVTKNITLLNKGKIGIVPGQVIFRIKGINVSEISDYSAKDAYGNVFSVNVGKSNGFVQLVVNDYVPVFAGTQQQIIVKYKINLKPQGVFFYHYRLPLLDTTIPIERGKVTLSYPENLHLTYVKDAQCNSDSCSWDVKSARNVEFELSSLPLPRTKMMGVVLFWYTVLGITITLFLVSLIVFLRKRNHHY